MVLHGIIHVIDLKTDSTYSYNIQGDMYRKQTNGTIKEYGDTIVLYDSIGNCLNKYKLNRKYFLEEVVLPRNMRGDTVMVIIKRIFKKVKSYYSNGDIEEEICWLSLYGYSDGFDDRKQGSWKYYNKQGKLIKIERYNKNKLKRVKIIP